MKIQLSRGRMISLSGGFLVLLLCGLFAWWGIGYLAEESNLAEELMSRRGKSEIAEILGRPGGVGETKKEITLLDQLNKSIELRESAILGPWREASSEARGEGKEWSKDPNRWKDELVKSNDEILKKTGKAESTKRVALAPDFYLGLEEFKQKSPRENQVPDLALQLSVSKRLVDLLIQSKERTLEGYPTPCLILKLQGPSGTQGESGEIKPKEKPSGKTSLQRSRYNLQIVCSPEVLFEYTSALSKDKYFFILNLVDLVNERDSFLKRSELAGKFTVPGLETKAAPAAGVEGEKPAPAPLLQVLAGDESLKVNLEVDFICWSSPMEEKTSSKGLKP